LKGAGPTPFSRMGDGRAVLRSSIREYLASEAMFHLGIPTSRALSLLGSEMKVQRETKETSAIVMRVSESHIRFGSFEIYYYSNLFDMLQELTDFTIKNHFSELLSENEDSKRYLKFLDCVIESTAVMIAKWQAFGFVHGVMNTDNMSILGLTFDYGPFGFLDEYNEFQVFNCSDSEERYAFCKQPSIGLWNLKKLSVALSPLIKNEEETKKSLEKYNDIFKREYELLMNEKLGLKDEMEFIQSLLNLLHHAEIDYTIFFRTISNYEIGNHEKLLKMFEKSKIFQGKFSEWILEYDEKLKKQGNDENSKRNEKLRSVNPKFILRNYLLEIAIEKAKQGDFSEVENLLKIVQHPFDEQLENESYSDFPPEWSKELHLTCSS
jgi:serine/tyrosine/threonine adenylyltransferase